MNFVQTDAQREWDELIEARENYRRERAEADEAKVAIRSKHDEFCI